MRDLKGDWRDIFNGFMLALDLRKMFLAFCGIIFTVFGIGAVTAIIGNAIAPEFVERPAGFLLHKMYATVAQSWHVIYTGVDGHPADWKIYVPYSIFFVLAFLVIWSYFGGAISRIAAYEIAKDGERIETAKALRFASKKFWSFFWAPLICAIGFAFFFLCCFVGGLIGKVLDIIPYVGVIGAPLVSLLLPLAILAGFIMTLILLGTVAGSSLFAPAVAAEGTDSFDAVSRGFSYVYSRPWHFLWYQGVSAVYGYICIGFVILFAVTMCHLGIKAGAAGFDAFGLWQKDHYDHIADASWGMILSKDHAHRRYSWDPVANARSLPARTLRNPCDPFIKEPYGRLQHVSARIVRPDWRWTVDNVGSGMVSRDLLPSEKRHRELEARLNEINETWAGVKDPAKMKEKQREAAPKTYQLGIEALVDGDLDIAGRAFILVDEIHPTYQPVNSKGEPANVTAAAQLQKLGYTVEKFKTSVRDPQGKLVEGPEAERWKAPPGRKGKISEEKYDSPPAKNPAGHKMASYIVTAWLIVILGLALGYPIAYFFSQQTMIYFILRKKVDGIEMNEVFEESEEEDRMPEPIAPPKPADVPPQVAPPSEGKKPEGK